MFMGWISPDGDKIECGYTEHCEVADELCEKLNIDPLYDTDLGPIYNPEEALIERGWIKIYTDIFTNLLVPHCKKTFRVTQNAYQALMEIYNDDPDCYDTDLFDSLMII